MGRAKKQQITPIVDINIQPELSEVVVKSKRGRKSKKEIQSLQLIASIKNEDSCSNLSDNDNIENYNESDNLILNDVLLVENTIKPKPIAKKRGRKPKGGKIVQQITPILNLKEAKPNIILHLKCSLKDLENNLSMNSVDSYNFNYKNNLNFDIISVSNHSHSHSNSHNNTNSNVGLNNNSTSYDDFNKEDQYNTELNIDNPIQDVHDTNEKINKDVEIKEIWKKLKVLEHNLHINNISDKKSACFWCTHDFDTPSIYIPKHYIKDSYHVYGCFCSPECASAFLMEENIDSSTKFERYHLINHIYSKIYDYKKNIKPAPNPYYMLEKYYGNLTIQEYRSLFKNDRSFLIVDKPLTRVLPEFHEDNDDFIINNKIIPSNTYQIKKKVQNKYQSKSNILNEKFGISN
uniref:MYM-type domain-containing protein n=1 Tax=viral metagenome TaxID=1070528 RepID=A0A6C0DHQ3_9ZZZZ